MVYLNNGISINWARPRATQRSASPTRDVHSRNSLAAIILATKSSRGESIVFHYPPEPRFHPKSAHSVRQADSDSEDDDEPEAPRRWSGLDGRIDDYDHPTAAHEKGSSHEAEQDEWVPAWRRIFGLDSSLLADIFTPQKSDVKFEAWIDDLVFLGKPVHRDTDGTWDIHESVQDDFLVRQVDLESTLPDIATEIQSKDSRTPMTSFHLVFALHTTMDHNYQAYVDGMYQNVVQSLTAALTHEEKRCEYVWKQCELIRSMKQNGETAQTNIATVWHDILRSCDLAEVIQQTYSAIANDEIAHLTINNKVDLSLAMPRRVKAERLPLDTDSDHPFLNSGLTFADSMAEVDPSIMPHYALILLEEAETIVNSLPIARVPPSMEDFLHTVQPTKSFLETAQSMKIPLQEVVTMARNLLEWRCALLTIPLSERYLYLPSPTADMSQLPRQAQVFARNFPSMPTLPVILANMSGQTLPYSAFIPDIDQTSVYLDALAWMIKEKWLVQLRTFVWIKIRAEIKAVTAREQLELELSNEDPWRATDSGVMHEEMFEDSILSDPYNATTQERLWLDKLAVRHPVADATLFRKVCRYFNGTHAVEKVIVRENISPKAMRRLLDIFDEDLVKCSSW